MAPGIAIGQAFQFKQIDLEATKRMTFRIDDIGQELGRLDHAIAKSLEQLDTLRSKMAAHNNDEAAQIFSAQSQLLHDAVFLEEVRSLVSSEQLNAEHILARQIELVREQFSRMENEVFRLKSLDIQDVYFRLLRNLLEIEHVRSSSLKRVNGKVILVAENILPSDIVILDREHILGIVLEEGSSVSHVAIIAKSQGIPAVINVTGIAEMIRSDARIIIDGYSGKVIVHPTETHLAFYREKTSRAPLPEQAGISRKPCATNDGRQIILEANASSIEDIEEGMRNGAEGIGLLRSELYYLSLPRMPTIDEEQEFYRQAISRCGDKPVTIRLLDVGADKSPPYLDVPGEDSPQLGTKGIRFLLERPKLFRSHLTAIVRAGGSARIKLLVPFVALPEELEQTRNLIVEICRQENVSETNLALGMMVEIPSTALSVASFAPLVDFFSIGTNDLVQYLFAASRENGNLEAYRKASLPLVLALVRHVVSCVKQCGKEVSVCGEIASNPDFARLLAGAGVTRLSLQPRAIQSVYAALTSGSYPEFCALAEETGMTRFLWK
jgi:phosphotransferase system enzyme I (PtsI)